LGFPEPRRLSITSKDGEERLVEFSACQEGECVVWLLRDLSESDRAARLLAQTVSLTQVGGWELDCHSMRLYWTAETYRLHDVTPEEYKPTVETAIKFYAPEYIPIITEAIRRGIDTGESYDIELEMITARKRRIHIRAVALAAREEGRTVKLYGAFEDITRRKKSEQERRKFESNLQQTQKLESLGVLSGGIAHDFNNLLTGILGNADLIRYTLPPESPVLEFVGQIERSAERAADLCRQMLAYAGKGRIIVGPCSLSDLVRETAQLLHLSVSRKATLTLCLEPDLPCVHGDSAQLRQVVMNLVINASEALGDREGLIAVTTGKTRLAPDVLSRIQSAVPLFAERDYVFLEVSDTGSGMDEL